MWDAFAAIGIVVLIVVVLGAIGYGLLAFAARYMSDR